MSVQEEVQAILSRIGSTPEAINKELTRRTEVEKEHIRLMGQGRYEEATELLKTI